MQDSNIIGTKQAVKALDEKEQARILLVSDSHHNYKALENIVLNYGKDCDAMIHSGDGISDLELLVRLSKSNLNLKKALPPVIAFVRGNCDPSDCSFPGKRFIQTPQNQILKVCGSDILIVHGHNQGVNFTLEKLGLEAKILNCKAAIYGHTHVASQVIADKIYLINPGSCSLPRGGQKPGFAILTVGKDFMDTAFLQKSDEGNPFSDFKIYTPPMA